MKTVLCNCICCDTSQWYTGIWDGKLVNRTKKKKKKWPKKKKKTISYSHLFVHSYQISLILLNKDFPLWIIGTASEDKEQM
jgi:hypothetical protein